MARIISGTELAGRIREETRGKIERLRADGVQVRLDAVIVGDPQAGSIFARSQERRCRKVGIDYHLHALEESSSNAQVQDFITALSRDADVTGIILNLPLPEHLDTPAAQYAIDPYKDIEGVNPANIGLLFYGTPIIAPGTAMAVMAILRETDAQLEGTDVVIVGQGSIVGKPIALALMGANATVTTCNEFTKELPEHTRQGDVLIAAAGVPGLIGVEHVKPGAVVIDVGINTVPAGEGGASEARVIGDVRFEEVEKVASAITPVPGGVGPVTVAMALHSTVEAAAIQLAARRIH